MFVSDFIGIVQEAQQSQQGEINSFEQGSMQSSEFGKYRIVASGPYIKSE